MPLTLAAACSGLKHISADARVDAATWGCMLCLRARQAFGHQRWRCTSASRHCARAGRRTHLPLLHLAVGVARVVDEARLGTLPRRVDHLRAPAVAECSFETDICWSSPGAEQFLVDVPRSPSSSCQSSSRPCIQEGEHPMPPNSGSRCASRQSQPRPPCRRATASHQQSSAITDLIGQSRTP